MERGFWDGVSRTGVESAGVAGGGLDSCKSPVLPLVRFAFARCFWLVRRSGRIGLPKTSWQTAATTAFLTGLQY